MRGRQSVRKGIWYLGGRRRKRRIRGFLPLTGLLGSAAGSILGENAKPFFFKFIGGKRRRR